MKTSSRSLFFRLSIVLAMTFGLRANGETPHEELAHAYHLVSGANADYAGHRRKAMTEIEAAAKELGLQLRGEIPENERQWKSDEQISEARRLLVDAREHMQAQFRERVTGHLNGAISELEESLRISQPARGEIAHAFQLINSANADYATHRRKAITEVQAAATELGIDLKGELHEHERQWKSDEQMSEARRLLGDARERLEKQDRDRVAAHLEAAVKEIEEALKVK